MKITHFYGANWCSDCKRSKKFLGENRIDYDSAWIDIETNEAAVLEVEKINNGKRKIPTIKFDDGSVLVEPSNIELAEKLGLVQELDHDFHEVLIIGGGPAGLTAALYCARDGLDVAIIEKSALGGQMGFTQKLDNYPGFPEGVAGEDLADKITKQVAKYGVEYLTATDIVGMKKTNGVIEAITSTGKNIGGKAVIISTGSKYRQLNVPGEIDLIGYKIHFCATCDFIWYRGQDVLVVGGGNSAYEESLFLARHVNKVTILVRSESRASKVLQDKVAENEKIEVKLNATIDEFIVGSQKTLDGVRILNRLTNEKELLKPDGVFLFVGLTPNSQIVKDLVELDRTGFIKTNVSLETKTPGLFACGDVRADSVKQAVSAMGEGAAVALSIREFLKSH